VTRISKHVNNRVKNLLCEPIATPLVEVGNLSDLEAVIEMLSTNAVKIKVGDEALIKRWGGSQDIHAEVKVIEPSG